MYKLKRFVIEIALFSLLPLSLLAYEAPRQQDYRNRNIDRAPSYYGPAYPYTAPSPPAYPYSPAYPTAYPYYYPGYFPNTDPFPGQRNADDLFQQNQHPPR